MESANSSNFLLQSGGGLQSQGGVAQGSGSSGVQSNGSPLFAAGGQQDILGQATVVGPVEFNTSKAQAAPVAQARDSGGLDFGSALVLGGLIVVLVFFALAVRGILRD